jgi:hypothetical protein
VRAPDLKALHSRYSRFPTVPSNIIFTRTSFEMAFCPGTFPLAEFFRDVRPGDFTDLDEIRRFIFESIAGFRLNKGRGIIAQFNRESFDEYVTFTRIVKVRSAESQRTGFPRCHHQAQSSDGPVCRCFDQYPADCRPLHRHFR